jgi:hypothetical protein
MKIRSASESIGRAPDRLCRIGEQIIEDRVSGLILQFELDPQGNTRLRIYGKLAFGNRELIFDPTGKQIGAGTCVRGRCRPSWITPLSSDYAA